MTYALAPYAEAPYAGLATAPAAATAGVMPISEFAIEFDPGVWTDVEVHRVSASTRRGRNAESGAFETGRGFVTLRNETRVYDPEYAAGPYYGKLRPNRRVRYRANYAGATYPVMVGYIDRITQDYPGPNEIVATIAFSDRFKILNRQELAVSAYASEVRSSAPVAWWPLDEPSGQVRDAISGARLLKSVGNPTYSQPSLTVRDPGASVSMVVTDALYGAPFEAGTFPLTTAGTIEYWYRKNTAGARDPIVGVYVFAPTPFGADPLLTTSGLPQYVLVNSAGTNFFVASTGVNLNDLVTHHVALTWSVGDTIRIYIDGVDRTGTTDTFAGTMANTTAPWGVAINGIDYPPFISVGSGSIGTYDEVTIYNTALSAATVAAHNAAGRAPWVGDLPGPRLARVLSAAGVAAADRNLDDGTTTLQATSLGGTVLAYMQTVADTEIGALFVDRLGQVRFIGRRTGLGADYQTSRATLTDEPPAATDTPYTSVTFEVDESDIVTRATVSREGSVAVTYSDPAAVAEFGTIDFVAEGLLHDSDTYSSDYAQWIVNTRKVPETRVGGVEVNPARVPAVAFPAMLSLELGDRVTLTRRPKVGAAITRDYRVEAIAHSNAAKQWNVSLTLSPFNQANNMPVFTWGVTLWGNQVWGL